MDEGCNHNEDMEDLMTLKLREKKEEKESDCQEPD